MPTAIEFTANAQQLIAESNRVSGAIGGLNKAFDSTAKVVENYNKQGQLVGATIKQQINAFTEYTGKLNLTKSIIDGNVVVTRNWAFQLEQVGSKSRSTVTTTSQLGSAVNDLTAKFKQIDPAITSVTVKNAKFDENMRLISGTAVGLGSQLGILTSKFTAHTGAIEATSFAYRALAESAKAAEKATSGGGGAFPKPAAPIPFSQQGRTGGGGAFPTPAAPVTGLAISPNQLASAVQPLVSAFQKLDPAINKVRVTSAQYDQQGRVLGGTLEATSASLGKLSTSFIATTGKLEAGNVSLSATTNKFREAEKSTGFFHSALHRLSGTFQRFVEYRAFNNITTGIHDGIQAAKDFQIQLSLIRTISQDSQQSFGKFGADARGVSDSSGVDLNKIAQGFYDTTSNQIAKGADVAPFVKTASDLARVTGSELPDAVNLLSSRINAYGLSVSDAERLSAQFFRTIDEGRVVAKEMASTLGRVDVIASNLGISAEEVNSVLAITTQKGFKTADAMTLLTNLMIKLEKPTEATAAFFQDLGVSSGEAAIKTYGFVGVLQKMVDSVKAGKTSVSAFFDEIRGRKQFGVFEQSIGDIERFVKEQENLTKTTKVYNSAKAIRGESPADQLVVEANKLKNAFTVDLGQGVLEFTANTLKAVGGVDGIKNSVRALTTVIEIGGVAVAAYGIKAGLSAGYNQALAIAQAEAALAAQAQARAQALAAFGTEAQAGAALTGTAANSGLATAMSGAGIAAQRLALALAPLALFASGYIIGKRLFGSGQEYWWDNSAISETVNHVQQLNEEAQKLRVGTLETKTSSLSAFTKDIKESYKDSLSVIAKLTVANNDMLEKIKERTRAAGDAVKLFFTSYTQSLQTQLSQANEAITKTKTLIEASKKSLERYSEQSDAAAFNLKLDYAQGADSGVPATQKLDFLEQRKRELIDKSNKLYMQGTEEAVQEARQVNEEITATLVSIAKERAALQRLGFENGLKSGLFPRSEYGPDIFTPDFKKFDAERAAEKQRVAQQEALDRRDQYSKQEGAKADKLAIQARIAAFKQAQKDFESLSPLNASGLINNDFKDKTGKFDQQKYLEKLNAASQKLIDTAPEDQRKQLELSIFQYRISLIQQAAAIQRQEDFKTKQERLTAEQDAAEKRIGDIQKERDALIGEQQKIRNSLAGRGAELSGFAANIMGELSTEDRSKIQKNLEIAQRANQAALDKPLFKDGIPTLDPDKVKQAFNAYSSTLDLIQKLRDKLDSSQITTGEGAFDVQSNRSIRSLSIREGDKTILEPGAARQSFERQLKDLVQNQGAIDFNLAKEGGEKLLLETQLGKPLEKFKKDFPELADTATGAFGTINTGAKSLAQDGLEAIRKQYEEIRKLSEQIRMPNAAAPADNVGSTIGGDATYAATGGIVGLFPGQPRGVDQYPVWAAKGERIFDAETSRIYRPLMDAIAARTAPRYMAAGGIVGDQSVGDITNNVTVNGGANNSETGRVVANAIERLLRRKQVRIKPN